jgi:hypothetical protein
LGFLPEKFDNRPSTHPNSLIENSFTIKRLSGSLMLSAEGGLRLGCGFWLGQEFFRRRIKPINRLLIPAGNQFPKHPLSRVRAMLAKMEATLKVDESVKRAPPFVYRSPDQRLWWQRLF